MEDNTSDNDDWLIPVLLISTLCDQQPPRLHSNRTYTGQDYVNDLLSCGNSSRIRNQLRMQLTTFNLLRDWLFKNTALNNSCHISIEEKLFIFIYIASSGMSNRDTQERFNRSPSVISKY
jgi:hypothetical protein